MAVAAHPSPTNCQAGAFSSKAGGAGPAVSLGRMLGLWRSRIRERNAFTSLNDRDLRDLGVSRWDVEQELSKPFWRG
jgi:uncharacterized protein YjiS (DUF1127 family)